MPKHFIKYLLLFFTPIIIGYGIIEYFTRKLPLEYRPKSRYLSKEKDSISVLILGSSQMKNAINPAFLSKKAINLASGNQHHDTDFKFIKQLLPKLKNLNIVVLEVSYSHFELPHNGKNFWKNSIYWEYYHLNNFERPTWFKDRLIYLAHPPFFSKQLYMYYIDKSIHPGFNKFGFDTLDYQGDFKKLNYNLNLIKKDRFKINEKPNPEIFKKNTDLFFNMLDYLQANKTPVLLVMTPMYKTYLTKRNGEILKRRDSVLQIVSENYPNIIIFNKEEDTLHYSVFDFKNQSHLNPRGAKIFTKEIDSLLSNL